MKTEIFQSTLPRGERHLRREIQRQFIHNFNPRSREGSDAFFHQFDCISMISIRAPARGATHSPIQGMLPYLFQSALPRGERLFSVHTFCRYLSFQSALPRGERRIWLSALSRRNNFNPRSREGSDLAFSLSFIAFFYFNPRSREGSDHVKIPCCRRRSDFNPRSREGSDPVPKRSCQRSKNFNPRSREGSDVPVLL